MKKAKLTSLELIADLKNGAADLTKWRKAIAESFDTFLWGKAEWFYLVATADLTGWQYENSPILAWNHCASVDEMTACFEGFPGWKYRGDYVPQDGEKCLIVNTLPTAAKLYAASGLLDETIPCDWLRVLKGLEIVFPSDF